MPGFLRDKYFLLCLAAGLLLMSYALTADGGGGGGEVGVVHDVRESENGYVYSMDMSDGRTVRCFSKEMPSDGDVCEVSGSYSDDGSILFVSSSEVLASTR